MNTIVIASAFAIYASTAVITGFNEPQDQVIVTTAGGYEYSFYGIEDYFLGDYVSLMMGNNGTPDISDDVIIDADYAGFTVDWCPADVYNAPQGVNK